MAIWYVSTGGNNSNPGTLAQPFRTVQRGAQAASAGDTVSIINDGIYDEFLQWYNWPGGTLGNSWAQAIKFMGYNGQKVRIRPSTNPEFVLVMRGTSGSSTAPRYIEFENVIFDGSIGTTYETVKITAWDPTVINADAPAHHIRFRNCRITSTYSFTSGPGSASGILITWGSVGCEIIGGEIDNVGRVSSFGLGPTGQCIYGAASDLLVDGVHCHHSAGYGISNVNSFEGLETVNHTVRNCVVHDCGLVTPGQGGGINEGEGSGHLIYNNIVYNCTSRGIILAWNPGPGANGTKIYNNTVYGCGDTGFFINTGQTNTVLRNNISYNNSGGSYLNYGTGTDAQYNSWNLFSSDPAFVNPGAGNFRLTASSPAIDVGIFVPEVTTDIEGSLRPAGVGYDLGAYEYGGMLPVDHPVIPAASGTIVVRDSMTGAINTPLESHVGEVGAVINEIWGDVVLTGAGRARPVEIPTGGGSGYYTYSGLPSTNEYDVRGSFRVMSDLTGQSHYAAVMARWTANNRYVSAEYSSDTNTVSIFVADNGPAMARVIAGAVWDVGDHTILLKVRADSLSAEVDGVQTLYVEDTTNTDVGRTAVQFYSNPGNSVALSPTTGIQLDELLVTNAASGGTVTLSGVQATTSLGAVGRNVTKALTGVSATASVGSLGKTRSVGLTGIAAATVLGIFAGYVPSTQGVTGQLQIGDVKALRASALSGVSATASVGAVVVAERGTVQLTGVQANTALGSLAIASNRTVALTGVQVTTSLGTLNTGANRSVRLTGIQATTALGTVVVPGGVTVALTGVLARVSLNSLTPPGIAYRDIISGELVTRYRNILTINGVERQMEPRWSITDPSNNVGTMRFSIKSPDGSYAPDFDDEVIFVENGVRTFAGFVATARISGIDPSGGAGGIVSDVSCVDYNSLASRRYFHDPLPAGTLKATLQILVPFIPRVTLDPSQPTGPLLEAVDYRGWKVVDVLNQLTTRTGYIWNINHYGVFQMYAPGASAAPFDIVLGAGKVKGEVTCEPRRKNYANRVIVYGKGVDGIAEDPAEMARHSFYELVYQSPETTDQATINALAATILAASLPITRDVSYETYEFGLAAGMTQQINLPTRKINNTYLINEVVHTPEAPFLVRRTVKATEGIVYHEGWRETVKTWGGMGGVQTIGAGSGGGGATTSVTRYAYPIGGTGEAVRNETGVQWIPAAGGAQVIGQSSVQAQISTVPRGGTDATVVLRCRVLEAGTTFIARLFDVTEARACPGVSATISSTEWVTVSFGTTLTPGSHFYELQVLIAPANADVMVTGYVE